MSQQSLCAKPARKNLKSDEIITPPRGSQRVE